MLVPEMWRVHHWEMPWLISPGTLFRGFAVGSPICLLPTPLKENKKMKGSNKNRGGVGYWGDARFWASLGCAVLDSFRARGLEERADMAGQTVVVGCRGHALYGRR